MGASLSFGSAARFASEIACIGLGFGTALITARSLGPDGKGVLSTLSYLAVLTAGAAALGLGEAGVTAAVRGARTLEQVTAATMGALLITCTLAVPVFVGAGILLFPDLYNDLTGPFALTAASIPCVAVVGIYSVLLDARQRFVLSAIVRFVISAVTAVGTVLLVYVVRLDLDGALIASLAGWCGAASFVLVAAKRIGLPIRPRWEPRYVIGAVRLGVPIQLSYLLMVLGSRVDLLLVSGIAGPVSAGRYSVSLTIGSIVTYAPLVLTAVSYPRLAHLDDDEFVPFVTRLSRLATLSALLPTVAVAVSLPLLLPLVFGVSYRGSTAPSVLLAVSGIFWGLQWVLCRARAARGSGRLLVHSFGTSLLVMVAADLALIGQLGLVGAGLASVVGSAAGAAVAVRSFSRAEGLGWRDLALPRREDVVDLLVLVQQVVRSAFVAVHPRRSGPT
jgi:O-antigen/teichoic acid export membrane protein